MPHTIRRMTAADIPAGMRLKAQNGWNQLERDWQRQLDLEPEGCFVAELAGHVVGTACACIFETVAWVNMVLVDQEHRGSGIGTSLTRHLLAWLDERRVPSIRLDATPLGRPIYEKFGFGAEYELTRYEGVWPAQASSTEGVAVVAVGDVADVIRFDRQITGAPRGKLLTYLHKQSQTDLLLVRGDIALAGYAAFRPGARAHQIGPCLGAADACRRLLTAIAQTLQGYPVFLDVPCANAEANAFAAALGLSAQRKLLRMGRGVRIHDEHERYWASFGPEKG